MELVNLLNQKSFEDVKKLLMMEPYYLTVKEDLEFPSLYMITYEKESENFDNPIVKQCRGIILEKNTNKIICYTFNHGIDADLNKKECLPELDWTSTKVQESVDGTQIRLFYYGNMWMYSTTRCIDAKKARWFSSRSFYEMFQDVEDKIDYEKLDRNCCYSFVLKHPENRIVVRYDRPGLVHVLTRNLTTLKEVNIDIGVDKPKEYQFDSYKDVINYALTTEDKIEGLVLCDKDYVRVKVKVKIYDIIKDLRGNTNNLFFRYLQLRYEGLMDSFLSFYPEYKNKFAIYDIELNNLAKTIHHNYMNKHVNHRTNEVRHQFKPIIYKLHGIYLETNAPTTVNMVMMELNKLHPAQICFMYNRTFAPHHPFHGN